MAGKKRASKSSGPADFWQNVEGWKQVEAGEDFLLGCDEYGFAGLEVLDAAELGDNIIFGDTAATPAPAAADGDAASSQERPAKRSKKALQDAADATENSPEDVAALKSQLELLRAENKKLKKQKQQDAKKKRADAKQGEKKGKEAGKAGGKGAPYSGQLQADETAPLADVSAWADYQLAGAIEGALARLGFSAPTHIQAECLPAAIRDRRDIIGAAQTGSGKTLAFGLPILQVLMQERQVADAEGAAASSASQPKPQQGGALRALVLAPTRELAMQVCDHLSAVGRSCGIWVVPIVGGLSQQKQERLLAKEPQVVVATPGRLWELMRDGQRHLTRLGALSFLVIDEADRMVQQGHYTELASILDAIPTPQTAAAGAADEGNAAAAAGGEDAKVGGDGDARRVPGPPLQTFVFSATLTLPSDMRKRLRKGGGGSSGSASLDALMDRLPFCGNGRPKVVDLTSARRVADRCSEAVISCPEAERDDYLYCLLAEHPGRTIVFVNAISSVRRLGAILKLLGLPVGALHAGMQQRQRMKALDRFKADPNGVLVATDVAARGLDIKGVSCVVHFQLPASLDTYVHRSGRTARAEAEGVAIAMVTPKEAQRYQALLRALGREEPPEFPIDESLMRGARERVRLAVRLDEFERGQSKAQADKSWRRTHAEELGLMLSDEEDSGDDKAREDAAVKGKRVGKKARKERKGGNGGGPSAEAIRGELAALLAQPLQPQYSQKYFTGGAASGVAAAAAKQQQGDGGASTVGRAVALAQQAADSRAAAAGDVQAQAAAGAKRQKKASTKRQRAAADPRAAALAAALRKRAGKKERKSPMFVVPRALGRQVAGPNALQALRERLGTGSGAT